MEMNMRRALPAFMLLLIFSIAAPRAAVPLRGFVIDATSGEPLPVANVMIPALSRGSATNLDGFFAIPNLEPGTYTLQISYLGYHGAETDIEVSDRLMDPITIELTPESVVLEEVVYTVKELDEKQLRESPRVSTMPMDAPTIRSMPSLGAEMDVLRAMQAIPGVKASSEISSALYVRGGSADMTLLQMDQSTVYNPSHLFGLFSTFNADAVKHIQLMKGGFPAEYGGRSGSVLEVVTNEGNRRETEGLVSVGIVSARAALEGPLPKKRGSYAISGRRTYFDMLIDALRKSSDEYKDLPDYFFYDGNGKINLDLTGKTTLTLGGYIGLDILTAEMGPDDSRLDMKTYWGNQTSTTRLRHVLGDYGFITFGVADSQYLSGFEVSNEVTMLIKFKNRFRDTALRTDFEFYAFTNHRLKTGVEAHRYSVHVTNQNEDVTFMSIDTTNWNIAHYLQDTWKIGAQFELMPGLRWYWHQDGNFYRFDPRMAAVYHYNERTRIKLAGGRYHQFVDIFNPAGGGSDFASFLDIWMTNDGSVEPMYADQIVFGFEHDPRPDLEFTLETYYSDLREINEYNNSIDRGQNYADAFFKGNGYAYGFEWMLRQKAGRLTGWIGYSLAWSKRRFPESYINLGDWYFPNWDRRHDFIAVGTYKLSKRWDMSTQWRYNTGQGYTRAMGEYTLRYASLDNDYFPDGNRRLLFGERNNYRLPADHRLDLTFIYNHKFFGNPAKLNLSIYNVYSRRAIWLRNYDTQENPVEVSDVKLLPILPMFSYEVRF